MLELLRNQSRSAAGAIKYVTIGTLLIIWAGLWYYYFVLPVPNASPTHKFVCVGTILSGFAIVMIGLLFGSIGRGAKGADTTMGIAPVNAVVPAVATPAGSLAPAPIMPAATPVAQTPMAVPIDSPRVGVSTVDAVPVNQAD